MKPFYLYFFKQYKNSWNNLQLRIRIEIIILFIVFFAFFTTRLISLFQEQLSNVDATETGLTQFIVHILVFFISLSIPVVHLNLLPTQNGLVYYRVLPLNKINTFWMIFFSHCKYQSIGFIFVLPVFIALLASANIFQSLYFLFEVILFQIVMILFISNLAANSRSPLKIILKYFLLLVITFGLYFPLYFFTDYFIIFDPIFFATILIFLIQKWKKNWDNWDYYINVNQKRSIKKGNQNRLVTYPVFRNLPFQKIVPLLAKEILHHLRNVKFIRIQIISLVVYCLFIYILHLKTVSDFKIYSGLLTVLYIWWYFSLQFNEKYIKADSQEFVKTLPFKYYQWWLAKFITESVYIIFMSFLLMLVYLFKGYQLAEVYQLLIMLLTFSWIVLATIINIKIIFYDKPRFAGYAYHFFIIFVSVMSANYFLIGPIIALILLIYFTYYSYREFAR